jgi:hypothetical protein
MSWPGNSCNFWKSRQIKRNIQRYQALVALILLLAMIMISGCSSGGAALDGLADDRDMINWGDGNAMEKDSAEQKDRMPKTDQNVPEELETATLALG